MIKDRKPAAQGQAAQTLWSISRRAMACEFTVCLPLNIPRAYAAAEAALCEIDLVEGLLSIFRQNSTLSLLNREAFARPVTVDARVLSLLQRAAELTAETAGSFDMASGAAVRAWGFAGGEKRVPGEAEVAAALARCGMRHVQLDPAGLKVRFAIEGLELNPGAIGKGFAIDQAVRRLREEYGVHRALLTGGRSSLYALGPGADGDAGWLVGIENPFSDGGRLATVRLRDRALGTSGTANQHFECDGRRYGHLIDPRTARPCEPASSGTELGSVSVLASDSATADALSTALFVAGLDKAMVFCENHREIAALMVLRDAGSSGQTTQPRVVALNLPPQDLDTGPAQAANGC